MRLSHPSPAPPATALSSLGQKSIMATKKTEEQEWELHTEKQIQAAFRLYDKDNKGTVSEDEVQYIMRYLNVYPTEVAMVNLIKQEMQDDEPTTYVTYDRLKTVMLRLLKTKEWEPDAEDILIQAFKVRSTGESGGERRSTATKMSWASEGAPHPIH